MDTEAQRKRLELIIAGLQAQLRTKEDEHLRILERLQDREEQSLRRSEERFRLLLTSAGEGIYGLDIEGRTTFINPAACDMLRWKMEEVLGRSMHSLIHYTRADGAPFPPGECPIHRSIRDGLVHHVDGDVFHRRDGSVFPVEYTSTPILEAGGLTGAVIVFRDITERRRIEQERERLLDDMRRSIEARDEFISVVSHELKTPLTPIKLYIQSVQRRLKRGQPIELGATMESMMEHVERLSKLIGELLDLSRIKVGKLEFRPEPMDLSEIVLEVVRRMRQESRESNTPVHVDAMPARGTWDRLGMELVVSNLVSNAMKYGSGRPVEVEVRPDGSEAVLAVRDQGIGIAPADISRLFRKFERIVSSRHFSGFGIGLWLVKEIVDAHRGRIEVASAPGSGSTFTVRLPA